ncbi:MAG: 16S rRNA (cytosine(1402)-N(4))-methyltransferase RsmH [Phycisphaerales bacterium JB039]
MPAFGHNPVLLAETLAALQLRPGETFVDATAGLGGHAAAAARAVGPGGRIVLNDLDPGNLEAAGARVREAAGCEVVMIRGNFADLPRALGQRGIGADALLADLGFASSQMDDAARGFSMRGDGPLDMRLDPAGPVTAAELIGTLPERELARILREFGEEPAAGRIARKLVLRRAEAPIERTGELAELVRAAIGPGGRRSSIDPATRTFQALRIAVNDELANLASLLGAIERASGRRPDAGVAEPQRSWLNRGARVALISFHSLEDRLVKRSMARMIRDQLAAALTDGAVIAGQQEIRANPRSRSARLRAIRLDPPG